jgi:hypothetical protein
MIRELQAWHLSGNNAGVSARRCSTGMSCCAVVHNEEDARKSAAHQDPDYGAVGFNVANGLDKGIDCKALVVSGGPMLYQKMPS